MGQTENSTKVYFKSMSETKFKFPTENEFQIQQAVKQETQFTTILYTVTIAKEAHPRTKFRKVVKQSIDSKSPSNFRVNDALPH